MKILRKISTAFLTLVLRNTDNSWNVTIPTTADYTLTDIIHTDTDGTPTPLPAMTPMVCTPAAAPAYASAKVMKTGQTTSYRTGDDGDIEAGRETSFFVLKANNPFGNTNRFTDELGGSTYTNNIVIDWSTFDGVSVLGWDRRFNGGGADANKTWENAIDESLAHSVSTFISGWRLPNYYEYGNIFKFSELNVLNYAPFNLSTGYTLWTSTTPAGATTSAFFVYGPIGLGYHIGFQPKTASSGYRWIAVRTFSVSGTTLT